MNVLDRFRIHFTSFFGTGRNKHHSRVDFKKLGQTLQYTIHNKHYFFEALTHRSYLQVPNSGAAASNERLEFLGDAVLNLVVAEFLFKRYSASPEGDLTKTRARFVNRKALITYAEELHLSEFILMSSNASQLVGKGMDTMLSDAFEAIIGAIYLDGGFQETQKFIERHITSALAQGSITSHDENFKSRLLEYSQAEGLGVPRYTTINEEGPDHDRIFTVEVHIGTDSVGIGLGKNKKDAEQQAAEKALLKLHIL